MESAPPNYNVCQFSAKTDKFDFFGLYLGKLPNYMQYFDSNNVESVAESWVEFEMSWREMARVQWKWMELGEGRWSWMEVGACFSNTIE